MEQKDRSLPNADAKGQKRMENHCQGHLKKWENSRGKKWTDGIMERNPRAEEPNEMPGFK